MKIEQLLTSAKNSMSKERKIAAKILRLEKDYAAYSDEDLKKNTERFKSRIERGASLDSLLIEAYATVREAAYRVLGLKLFEVQLMGGIVLHHGNLAEMKTGEGKTLAAVCPAYLNALTGKGVYIVTVNEYLARRDCEEMGKVYDFLGLSTGLICAGMRTEEKKQQYLCDIIYGVNSEFGFDYLRDNMVLEARAIMQRKPHYAIIDEIDSILIDEARTPLIISGAGAKPSDYYVRLDRFVKTLDARTDYEIDTVKKSASLTDAGIDKMEKTFGLQNYTDKENIELIHHVKQALQANWVMNRDQDYVIIDQEVQIVDPFTGRVLPGRRYSDGLHQAIEAKEEVLIKPESETLATITYQNYFRLFQKISGMSGTAYTQQEEFRSIYGMNTVVVPTNKKVIRQDREDLVFITREEKDAAILHEIIERHRKGQPVLVGTIFVSQSEKISRQLRQAGIAHRVLNAVQSREEAQIISQAGQKGAVTIATNMAGRGTDIKLGEGVDKLGGLFILGTEKHDSIRIDNQLRGRSGRQGDPGETVFFVSLEDDIFKRAGEHYHEKIKKAAEEFVRSTAHPKGKPIEDKMIAKAVESAQKNVEFSGYQSRLSTIKFDQIINKQRLSIYKERRSLILGEGRRELILSMIDEVITRMVDHYTSESPFAETWDIDAMEQEFYALINQPHYQSMKAVEGVVLEELSAADIKELFIHHAKMRYHQMEEESGSEFMRKIERIVLLSVIDLHWVEYLDVIDQMRQGITLQAVGGIDPLHAFNQEAFNIFEDTMHEIRLKTLRQLFLANGALQAQVLSVGKANE